MRVQGCQTRYSSWPVIPPRISTVRVVPTPRGSGLVQVTFVMTLAQCGQDVSSASTSNSCSGVIARSTVLTNRYGADSTKSRPTLLQGCRLAMLSTLPRPVDRSP